jgi:HNH endonuclease
MKEKAPRAKLDRKLWREDEVRTLLEMYPDHNAKEIAEELNCRTKQVEQKISLLRKQGAKLEKSESFKKTKSGLFGATNATTSTGNRFGGEGFVPWNKGKTGYMSANKTSFKKGNVPPNTVEVGDIVLLKNKHPYYKIKIEEPNKWELLHRWVWIQSFGEIPEGWLVKFKDGNYENCEPENLYLQDRKGNMRQNSIHNYPQELQDVMRLIAKLKKTIIQKKEQS